MQSKKFRLIFVILKIIFFYFSLDRTSFDAVFHIEHLNIVGKYIVDGKVLLLNLQGEGPANITAGKFQQAIFFHILIVIFFSGR